ncbi:MAG: PD-(D/E)XK nuclease family protein, partial [bacterium]|nr:PD-(D/E)XK nuclease family protein [bacterium]
SSLNLHSSLENIELMQTYKVAITENELNLGKNGVILTTAHKSKGQEYAYVFIVKTTDKKWGNNVTRDLFKLPSSILNFDKDEKKDPNEDERRLFYVALTRAKKQIYITYSNIYYTDGNSRETMPSMFIEELDKAHIEKLESADYENNISEFLENSLTTANQDNTSEEEKEFLQEVFKNFKLSATSLNLYLKCPYKFKLKEIFRTPQYKNKALCLGSAIHYALERYGKEVKENKSPDVKFLINRFNDSLAQEILDKKDFNETKQYGEKILTYYFNAYKDNFIKPLFTELRVGIGTNPMPFLDENIRLQGVIDKIEPTETQGYVKVVDYKSGRPKSSNEIEGKTKNSDGDYKRQLIFYKLLCDLDKSLSFVVKEAEIDFVESASLGKPKKVSFEITKEQVDDLKVTIKKVMKDILDLKFGRTTDTSICKTCEFIDHCWPAGLPTGQIELDI